MGLCVMTQDHVTVSGFSQKNKTYKMGLDVCLCVCVCVSCKVLVPLNNFQTTFRLIRNLVYI